MMTNATNRTDMPTNISINKSVHSDFLIHWTGDDIDRDYDKKWWEIKAIKVNKDIIAPYLKRLNTF